MSAGPATSPLPCASAQGRGEMPAVSLREQQKIRTRDAIRSAAMRLFAARGYEQTTVEQIAREAEVSHTTFFRYFQTKEQVVLSEELDDRLKEEIDAIPPGLGHFELLRRVVTAMHSVHSADAWASDPERIRLIRREPLLHEAHQAAGEQKIAEATDFFAEYLGVDRDDFALGVFVAAVGGVVFRLVDTESEEVDEQADYERIIRGIDLLERGLPLG